MIEFLQAAGGVALLLEILTDNRHRTASIIRPIELISHATFRDIAVMPKATDRRMSTCIILIFVRLRRLDVIECPGVAHMRGVKIETPLREDDRTLVWNQKMV